MALHKLVRRNFGGKLPVSIKYQNIRSFKKGMILLCPSILEIRRILHLHDSARFKIPLSANPTNWLNTLKHIVGPCRRLL